VSVQDLSISRLPYVIAMDQGLYKKYGLNVELWTPSPDNDRKVVVHGDLWIRALRYLGINMPKRPDVSTNGGTPMMIAITQSATAPQEIVVGATDCAVRAHIVARKGIHSVEELKGKRIGVSAPTATPGFMALVLAQKMGWDPVQDISIIANADKIGMLIDGSLDAVVAMEREYADAERAGLPILLDMTTLNKSVAGNSMRVDREWLKDETHREAIRRFLKATTEAIALFHQRPELAMAVMEKWYGIPDRKYAETLYSRGAWIPKKPYPCYDGFKKTMEFYDSLEMRRHKPEDFYDDSFVKELDASGFIDALYKGVPQAVSTKGARF
jgi:ABC-type nitrate/sulfonate/bicarbonate transport system substrate-binding protein